MHLTCPSCGATFLVEPEHLGPTGRRVRCGECGHVWHQERPSEADAAERSEAKAAAAPFAPSEPTAEPAAEPVAEPAPEPAAKPAAKAAPEPAPKPAPEPAAAPKPAPEPIDTGERGPRRTASKPPRRARGRRESSLAAGWILFLVVVTGLAAGFYFGRAQLVAMVPQMTRLYDLVGLSAEPGGAGLDARERKEPVGAGLVIRDLKHVQRLTDGAPIVVVKGLVANVSKQTRKVPPLRAILTDANGVEVARWTFSATATALPPGETTSFETIPKDPPGGSSIEIVFIVEK